MASWRRFIGAGVLCLVLQAVNAVEIYDDNPGVFEPDFIYQDDNYPDLRLFPNSRLEDPVKDLMLYKLLKNMQANEMPYAIPFYKPKYTFEDKNLSNGEMMKEPVKRLTHVLTNVADLNKITKPAVVQQRWKIKKGKKTVGSQMLCYFKLCAFRAP